MTMTMKGALSLAGVLTLALAGCGSDPVTPPKPTPTGNKPVIKSFSATPTSVARGGTTQLAYEVTNATSVSFSTDTGTFATPAELMGTLTSPAINADTVFILTATGEGGSTTQRVTVTIDANAVAVLDFAATPNPVRVGGMVTLSWRTAGGKSITLTRDGTEILSNAGDRVAMSTEVVTVGSGTVRFRLEVANEGGTMTDAKEVMVTTAEPVEIRAFTVRPQVFTGASGMISVSWTTFNATSLTLTANGTAVPGFMGNVATGTVTMEVTQATRFELTAQGLEGPLTRVQNVSSAVTEVEPNDTQATATPLNGGGAQGEITADDVDYFTFMVPEGGNVTAQVTDGMGGCAFDSTLTLLDANGDEVAFDDDGGVGLCSYIDPRFDRSAAELPAGTYTLRVAGYDDTETGLYALVVLVGMPGCGNEIIETGRNEQCDDGNMATGDGCDAQCRFEIRGSVTMGGDMTFTGAIPANGLAAYSVTLTSDGFLAAESFAPMVGFCTDADTFLVLLDASGAVLGVDEDGGIDPCAAISPARDTYARLGAGTYTLLLGTNDGSPLPAYAIRIRALGPGCGNGLIEMGEACDDGNTTSGDGCTAMCAFEYAGTVMGGVTEQTFSGALPLGGQIRYEIVINSPVYFFAETGVPTLGMCGEMDSDTLLVLTSSSGREVARNDDFGGTLCSRIEAGSSRPQLLAPATYTLTVRPFSAAGMVPAVQTRVRLLGMGCGNGVVEMGETCDDGNTTAGDGCNATCAIEYAGTVMGGVADQTFSAAIAAGARVSYQIVVTSPAYIIAETGVPTVGTCAMTDSDTLLVLTDSMGVEVTRSNDYNGTRCSRIDPALAMVPSQLAVGTYTLSLRGGTTTAVVPVVQTRIRLAAMGCGNGILEGAEVCDDGNTTADGNGCSATCTFDMTIVQESEPNDTSAQADAAGNTRTATVTVTGGIDRMGADIDVYAVDVAGTPASLTARTHGRLGEPRSGCTGRDTVITLTNAQGTVLARNDDAPGIGVCSEISMTTTGTSATALAPGRYYISVIEFGMNAPIDRYFLDLRLR